MREKGKPIGYLINTLKGKIADAMSKKNKAVQEGVERENPFRLTHQRLAAR